jgi:hypothetical protein
MLDFAAPDAQFRQPYSRRTAVDAIFSELCISERTLQRRETFAAVDDARDVMREDV